MSDKKQSRIKLWLIAGVLLAISSIVFMGAMKDGMTTTKSSKAVDNVSSINDLQRKVNFKLDVPSYVTDTKDKLQMEVVAGQIAQINTDKFVFKASYFVDNDADILGLYEKSKTEKKYNVNDSDIKYFKYRQGYKDYPNCTLLNWCTDETTYGLMIEDDISFEKALDIIGIDKKNISEVNDTESTESTDNTELKEYKLTDNLSIDMPEFKQEIRVEDLGDQVAVYAGNALLFVVAVNNAEVDLGSSDDASVIDAGNGTKIYYNKDNTYDPGTDDYSDYELWLSTIDSALKTLINKE